MTKNGSAAGIDGLPYEFHKWLEIEFGKDEENTLDMLEFLESIFRDIDTHGVTPRY